MRTSRTFARAALATPLLMLAFVACGSDEADSDSEAADPSDAARSESAELAEQMSAHELAALLDEDRLVAQRFTMTIEGGGESYFMSGETTPDEDGGIAGYYSMVIGGESSESIIVDGHVYNTLDDGEWSKTEIDPEIASTGMAVGMLNAFMEGFETLDFVGSEELDGEIVQRYTGGGEPPALDFYFDADGHLTYVWVDINEATLTIDFFDFGAEDIIIEAPPADQIVG